MTIKIEVAQDRVSGPHTYHAKGTKKAIEALVDDLRDQRNGVRQTIFDYNFGRVRKYLRGRSYTFFMHDRDWTVTLF